jgi:hypothetical protein
MKEASRRSQRAALRADTAYRGRGYRGEDEEKGGQEGRGREQGQWDVHNKGGQQALAARGARGGHGLCVGGCARHPQSSTPHPPRSISPPPGSSRSRRAQWGRPERLPAGDKG